MQETQVQFLGCEDPLEKEMATHSSILAWEIPWTEEPGGLYSPWGHKRVRQTEQACAHQALRDRMPRGLHYSVIHTFLQRPFEAPLSILLVSTFHTPQFLLSPYRARFSISSPSL